MKEKGFSSIYIFFAILVLIPIGFLIYKSVVNTGPKNAVSNEEPKSINTSSLQNNILTWSSAGENFIVSVPEGFKIVNQMVYSEDGFQLLPTNTKYQYAISFNNRQEAGFAEGDNTAHCDDRVDKKFGSNTYTEWRCYLGPDLKLITYTPAWNQKLGKIELSLQIPSDKDAFVIVEQILTNLKKIPD